MFFLTLLKHVMDSERGNFKAVRVNKFPSDLWEHLPEKSHLLFIQNEQICKSNSVDTQIPLGLPATEHDSLNDERFQVKRTK